MIFHSVSSSDFPCSNLTGNNCTYCGGSIEDNYPPAGELTTKIILRILNKLSAKLSVNLEDQPLYHPFSTTCSPRSSSISSSIQQQVAEIILNISQAFPRGISFPNFPFSAIAVAVLCFPFGIIGCCMLKEKQCVKCNRSFS